MQREDALLAVGWSKTDFHELSGISRPTINKFIAGEEIAEPLERRLRLILRLGEEATERGYLPIKRRRGSDAAMARLKEMRAALAKARDEVKAERETAKAAQAALPADPQDVGSVG